MTRPAYAAVELRRERTVSPRMISVTLYTKTGCDLCREARDELDGLAAEYPHHVTEVDILEDPQLFERYRHIIPVVVIGQARLVYPFSSLDLRAALHSNSNFQLKLT